MSRSISIEHPNKFAAWTPNVEQELSEETEWSGRSKIINMLIMVVAPWSVIAALISFLI